jgi:hypothetical protein
VTREGQLWLSGSLGRPPRPVCPLPPPRLPAATRATRWCALPAFGTSSASCCTRSWSRRMPAGRRCCWRAARGCPSLPARRCRWRGPPPPTASRVYRAAASRPASAPATAPPWRRPRSAGCPSARCKAWRTGARPTSSARPSRHAAVRGGWGVFLGGAALEGRRRARKGAVQRLLAASIPTPAPSNSCPR